MRTASHRTLARLILAMGVVGAVAVLTVPTVFSPQTSGIAIAALVAAAAVFVALVVWAFVLQRRLRRE